LKAVFPFLTEDIYIDRFTLSKSIDNTFVKSEINTELKLYALDHDYLLKERLAGNDKEIGIISHDCENQVFEKDVFISHNEGTFDLKHCITTKKLKFGNPLDCLIGVNKINMFDYPAGVTQTVQGDLVRQSYGQQLLVYLGDESMPYTLEQIILALGGIPDKTGEGYAIESIEITAIPQYETLIEESGNTDQYTGHDCQMYVGYVGATSGTQIDSNWIDIDGTWYLNPSIFPVYNWGAPYTNTFVINNVYYVQTSWNLGTYQLYKDIGISNTVDLNAVLIGLFECTGLTLVSNFFNINADSTNPTNKYYDFATSYCHNIKIAQSFDIIRESSIQDSFGKSGFLVAKELLTDISLFFNLIIIPDETLETIRWEHVSYYQTKGYDLTARTDVDIAPLESEKEQIDSELFLMAQPTSDEFYKVKVKYNTPDLYKEENEKKYQVKKFLTDVFTTLNNAKFEGSEYEYLFYLLSTDGENIISLNNQFSINNIFRNLHDLNRPYKSGQIGDTYIDFAGFSIGLETTIKFMSSVITWDNIYPFYSVKTNYGTFKINSIEANEKGLITLKAVK